MSLLRRLFPPPRPVFAPAEPEDALAIARLHGTSFHRGWSDGEVDRMLRERNVVADRVTLAGRLAGFIISRLAADESEILSVAIDGGERGRGLARLLLDWHLRRLADLGVHAVFLEVEEGNGAARRLYQRARFRQVGERRGYYPQPGGTTSNALILRRDLT